MCYSRQPQTEEDFRLSDLKTEEDFRLKPDRTETEEDFRLKPDRSSYNVAFRGETSVRHERRQLFGFIGSCFLSVL